MKVKKQLIIFIRRKIYKVWIIIRVWLSKKFYWLNLINKKLKRFNNLSIHMIIKFKGKNNICMIYWIRLIFILINHFKFKINAYLYIWDRINSTLPITLADLQISYLMATKRSSRKNYWLQIHNDYIK